MIRIYSCIATMILIHFLLMGTLYGQDNIVEVKKSNDKIILEGKPYFIHIVKEGQTLFAISRVYNVSQKVISKENPTVKFGLQAGQALKIPAVEEKESEEFHPEEPEKYIYHSIEENQTIYSISVEYNISVDEILKSNSELDINDIPIGTQIRIPRQKFQNEVRNFDIVKDNFTYYRVGKKETLYSISRKFNIPVREIRRSNDGLKGGPKYGQYIRIPIEQYEIDTFGIGYFSDVNEIEKPVDSMEMGLDQTGDLKFTKTINVALMLPFHLNENDERIVIDSSEVNEFGNKVINVIERKETWIYPQSFNFIEFYEGALIAIDSLQNAGLSVNLYVFDTENDSNTVQEELEEGKFRGIDLIVGPAYSHNLEIVADYAKSYRIPVVSPMSSRSEFLEDNPYLFQIRPSLSTEFDKISNFISKFYDKNIVMIHPGDSMEMNHIYELKQSMFSYFFYRTYYNEVVFKEVVYNETITRNDTINSIEHALSADIDNVILIASGNEAFVSSVVSNLNTLSQDYKITLFGYSNWLRFKNIEFEHFCNLNLHISTPFLLDYKKTDVKDFISKFRKEYFTEPDQFSFAWFGYDIMYYFLSGIGRYGKRFRNNVTGYKINLLQADYEFRRINRSCGFENKGMFFIRYDKDFEITRINSENEFVNAIYDK
jgi:LysM repeat protein